MWHWDKIRENIMIFIRWKEIPMKHKIEKNTVQETLIIPLYFRKLCLELYPMGRNCGVTDWPNRLRIFRSREKFSQPDSAFHSLVKWLLRRSKRYPIFLTSANTFIHTVWNKVSTTSSPLTKFSVSVWTKNWKGGVPQWNSKTILKGTNNRNSTD